jgi:ABC-2 type transport system permease protein
MNNPEWIERLATWWTFFRISVEERLVYRVDYAMGTLLRFLPIITQIFLWWTIFESAAAAHSQSGEFSIEGYRYHDMVAYYLLVTVSRAFSSMPGLTPGIARQIRDGEIKKYLIQPIDMIGSLLLQRIAHKFVYYVVAILPFALVFYLLGDFFPNGWPSVEVMLVFVASLLLSFLLGFFLEVTFGLLGFWFLEIASLTFVFMLLNFFLSGHMFPLELLPREPINWQWMVDVLPFKYLAYFPAAVFLGKVQGAEMYWGLAIEFAWVVVWIAIARIAWSRGVARYSGFGG